MGIKQDRERGRRRQRQRYTARTCSSSSICITENSSIIARAFKCRQLRRACYELRTRRSVNRGSTRGVGGWGFTKLAIKIDAKKRKPKGKKTKATSLHVRSGTHANTEKHLPRWLPPPTPPPCSITFYLILCTNFILEFVHAINVCHLGLFSSPRSSVR